MGLTNFTYKGKEFFYEDHLHNSTRDNERGVELALAKEFLRRYDNIIEVGAVTPYYFKEYTHEVFDLEDTHPRAKNVDASGMDFTGKNVLCISTVEHFKDNSVPFIKNIIENANKYLITFPLGYNERIDSDEKLDKFGLLKGTFMSRIDPRSTEDKLKDNWVEKTTLTDDDKKYGNYQWASTIAIFENFI